ncbi:MAG: glycosyltransferase family 4 protein [Planctomycetota bacterium]
MLGGREHYAVARALLQSDQLWRMYTDAWRPAIIGGLMGSFNKTRRLAMRHHPDVPRRYVRARTWQAVARRMRWNLDTQTNRYDKFLEEGDRFASFVSRDMLRHLARPGVDPSQLGYFGYTTGARHTLEALRGSGVLTVIDQIDPSKLEEDLVDQERAAYPGWEPAAAPVPDRYWDHSRQEWELADVVLVNSLWSAQALTQQGVPAEKIIEVPLVYNPPPRQRPQPVGQRDRLRVLFLGQVNLRKGAHYLMQAAQRLPGIDFQVVGPVLIDPARVKEASPNMTFAGPTPRGRVTEAYFDADVFVLPTLSDGFALTQLEAMAHALPVVATPNCGRVVEDGVNGRIVAAGDAESLAAALDALDADRAGLRAMSQAALETSGRFGIDGWNDWFFDALENPGSADLSQLESPTPSNAP